MMISREQPSATVADRRSAGSQTVDKAMQVLGTVADQREPMSLGALSRASGIEKTTTHRLVTSLVRYGLLRFDSRTRTYTLGLGLMSLGQRALAQLDIAAEAQPFLQRLAELSEEAVHLGVLDDDQVIYVAQVPSTQPVVIRAQVGTHGPVHCTAMGKVLLAFGPAARTEAAIIGRGLPAVTPNTISDPEEFREHLHLVRQHGYAIDDEENRIGIRCVGAPVLDGAGEAIAAISITGPAFRVSRDRIDGLIGPLREATGALSARLGFGEPDGRSSAPVPSEDRAE